MTTTERAAVIRTELKARHGWTSRDVSVKADYFSMGSAIRVRIKNPSVKLDAVKAIAENHESIDRDQWGDILSGGNRYVSVSYSREACAVLELQHLEAVAGAHRALDEASENSLIPIDGTDYMLGRTSMGWGLSLWMSGRGHRVDVQDDKGASLYIAIGSWNQ